MVPDFLPMPEAGIDGTEGTTGAPTTGAGTFIGEIPTGLFGNEGGAGFGGGPLVVDVKLLPKIIKVYLK